ncbi:fumarylacetoacetate hydrolase family protein [Photobacterium ganghwense]|uniref:fumarylacetoacetate hydrolase family protein n=1 Tax=Photobacterium ganghwense TaxID=320778 RepID=UPI001C2DCAEE|nr:fumarylacetoacetate hydrolase family protein [Photobacterium ganghwense]MBV1841465.1 fumarylacetoacetate hydrolase family protein [Photobacterium ganghwense]
MKTVVVENTPVTPGKIICVGRNYVAHIHELGNDIPDEMVLFSKPSSAITNQLSASHNGDELHYEAELAYLYQDGVFSAVAVGLDLTKREVQNKLKEKGLPWDRCKAFDGAALFSPFVSISPAVSSEALQETPLGLTLHIDGELTQSGTTDLMIYKPDVVLAEIQKFMTLENGDIVMTGTPAGVGKINAGAVFSAAVVCGDHILTSVEWTAAE